MPFPANWLEELVTEWLDLEGFVISTSVFVSVRGGGRIMPDVVGAKLDTNGRLLIRHCEAAMNLIDNPEKVAERYSNTKFCPEIMQEVRTRFGKTFGTRISDQAEYEKWVIVLHAGVPVRKALEKRIRGIQIRDFADFIRENILPAIKQWKLKPYTTLPPDKWLLNLIDWSRYFGPIEVEKPGFVKPGEPAPESMEANAEATKTSPAKTAPKAAEPKRESLASYLNTLLREGGNIKEITKKANVEADRLKVKKITAGQVRAHAKWRSGKGAYTVKEDTSGFIQMVPAV